MSLIDFFSSEFSVIRTKKGTYVKGRYIQGEQEQIKVWGSMQPTNARELKLPEEGNRLKQFYKFYTDEPILTDSMATLATGDRVIVNDEEYRAMSPLQWQGTDLDYFMTIIWREPQQAQDGVGKL